MTATLNPSRLVRCEVNLSPIAAARRGFGTLMIIGDSAIINGYERYRSYTDLDSVADDFGTSAPEYLAAALYFGQSPRPETLMIGRWLQAATSGALYCGVVAASAQAALLASLKAITDGEFKIAIDGDATPDRISSLDFHSCTTLSGCATVIDTALTGANCEWDGEKFIISSASTGVNSSIAFLTAGGGAGTEISGIIKGTSALGLLELPGYAAEEPVAAIADLCDKSGAWYGLGFAVTNSLSDAQILANAAYVEAASPARMYGVTETDANTPESVYTSDIAYQLEALEYARTFCVYSANANAACSVFGRAFSVNFSANRSTITLMYKQMPGITAENLTETQALTLEAKKCNVFAAYQNDTAILQYGVMCDGSYIDERHGLDWFQDALQTAEYNLLYTSKTKIPQTDAGQNMLIAVAAGVCQEAVNNGLVAPGTWNAAGFGQIELGDYLKDGYYIYSAPMALQAQADREQRIAPPIQIALKLAGAIHEMDVIVDVNR